MPRRLHVLAAATLVALAATGCGGPSGSGGGVPDDDWQAVLDAAEGQTVDWYLPGGDDRLDAVVDGLVTDRLAALGVTLHPVHVDPADALGTVLDETRDGHVSGGSVDAIWLDGETFATGVQADLWRCGWTDRLPSSQYVDSTDPVVTTDLGVPVDGCEAPWHRTGSALVYDSAVLDESDVESLDSLLSWAAAHPGRFTYPTPSDPTGAMVVRTVLRDTIGGFGPLPSVFDEAAYDAASAQLFHRLADIAPTLWRGGAAYPQSQQQVEDLYAAGEISAYFTYAPDSVGTAVDDGVFPATTRETVLAGGNLSRAGYLAIPANANDQAGAMVLANVLQDPEVQLELYRSAGISPVIDPETLDPALRQLFAEVPTSPSVLTPDELEADAVPELGSAYVAALAEDWDREIRPGR